MLILEKAYAKVYGSYSQIEGGITSCAIRDLTGAPYASLDNRESTPEACWAYLVKNLQKQFILTASARPSRDGCLQFGDESGIVSQHAYAILDAQVVNSSEKIIKLRNPWGQFEWSGDWSDKSSKWTPQLKKQLGWSNANDGTFWMPLSSYVKYFGETRVSMVHENYLYAATKINISDPKQVAILPFIITQENTHGYISVSQASRRSAKLKQTYDYAPVQLFVVRGTQSKVLQLIESSYFIGRDVHVECTFAQKGEYFVYVEVDCDQSEPNEFVVSSYASNLVAFSSKPIIATDVARGIADQIILSRLLRKKQDAIFIDNRPNLKKFFGRLGGYIYLAVLNQSNNITMCERAEAMTQGLQICSPFSHNQSYEIKVAPGQNQIVKYTMQKSAKGCYKFQPRFRYTLDIKFTDQELIKSTLEKGK